jgi:hypothetical protein
MCRVYGERRQSKIEAEQRRRRNGETRVGLLPLTKTLYTLVQKF